MRETEDYISAYIVGALDFCVEAAACAEGWGAEVSHGGCCGCGEIVRLRMCRGGFRSYFGL